ncbi:uncharacterized protein STEHIDRAFT_154393 [Stereum hirsutum FP-91666 SS1]|uniref:uncharacterized protein n=1 Tax=Stereum hirsutum (strain FP-91666) TaxID=721885 RepID=UPI000440D61C|nr:uncharacterized protein STEHIDRAFT_154393 [Stereum hirsutum FP-91666 SS1]EIM88666.1 hypothetical protein STEHIDRAFT_154393 [Stereum hirsutum FP-91666 SS1]
MAIMSWAGGSVGFSIVRDFVASRTPPGQLRKCQELLAEVDELLGELTDEERTRMALLNPEFMSRLSEDIHTWKWIKPLPSTFPSVTINPIGTRLNAKRAGGGGSSASRPRSRVTSWPPSLSYQPPGGL